MGQRGNSFYALVCLFASMSTMLYFPIIELLSKISLTFPTSTYKLFNYAVFAVTLFVVVFCVIFVWQGKVYTETVKALGLVLLIILMYGIYGIFFSENFIYFSYFMLWGIPALVAGMYIPALSNCKFLKILEPFAMIMGVAAFLSVLSYLSIGNSYLNKLSFGGTNYQGLAYTAAFSVGLELYYALLANQQDRFKFYIRKAGRLCELTVAFLSSFAVLVSGGRGGMIVLVIDVAAVIYILSKRAKKTSLKSQAALLGVLLLAALLVIFIVSKFSSNPLISDSLTRLSTITSVQIDSNGISSTSGDSELIQPRNDSFLTSLALINAKPLFGYGIFNIKDTGMVYPHNIILETCLQGGVCYLMLWIGIFVYMWKKAIEMVKQDINNFWIILYLVYITIFLNVSGTYLWCSQLWFIIGVLCSGQVNAKEFICRKRDLAIW